MDHTAWPAHLAEEYHINLARDGGRLVLFGGDAYEDDLEPADGAPTAIPTAIRDTPGK